MTTNNGNEPARHVAVELAEQQLAAERNVVGHAYESDARVTAKRTLITS